jgi:DNA phosphorothioation-dependent restriction protein DptH
MRAIEVSDLNRLLAEVIAPSMATTLGYRHAGHCMQVTDLSGDLARATCTRLRELVPDAEAYVLSSDNSDLKKYDVTGAKLVELRNPLPDGQLRPPLLVFLPAGLHASVEDSFSVATFENLNLGNVYNDACAYLLARFPLSTAQLVESVLQRLPKRVSDVAVARYLLTIAINEHNESVVGAALYELGLLPDFGLHKSDVDLIHQLQRNQEKTEIIVDVQRSERARALALGLTDRDYIGRLAASLLEHGSENPALWLRRIALDAAAWPFAFNRWPLTDTTPQDRIFVHITGSNLPVATEADSARGLEPEYPYLPLGDVRKKFRLDFRTDPPPAKVPALSKFVIEILSQDEGLVGVSTTKKAWIRGDKSYAEFSLSKLEKGAFQSGWHFARVRPYNAEGNPLSLVDENGQSVPWGGTIKKSDQDYAHEFWFYVATELESDEPPDQRAVPLERSLERARIQIRSGNADARRRTGEVERIVWRSEKSLLEVSFGREGLFQIPMAPELVKLEKQILEQPLRTDRQTLLLNPKTNNVKVSIDATVPVSSATPNKVFFELRNRYFHLVAQDGSLTSQAATFHQSELSEAARAYAEAYQDALVALIDRKDAASLVELRTLLTIDTVPVTVQHRHHTREASLIAPTHPLRALWYAAWTRLGSLWTEIPLTSEARQALLEDLDEHAFPSVVPHRDGRLHTPIGELAPGWTLCAPPTETDPRGLLAEVCVTLGIAEPVGEDGVRAAELARRLRRYLVQHPYITTLTINAFNAGQAGVLAQALVELQKKPELADILYDIRLFVDDPLAHGVGLGLLALLATSDRTTDQAAEAFALPTGNPLQPKLSLSIQPTNVFRSNPYDHRAHITFLFDVFPAAEVRASRAQDKDSSKPAPLYGLVQDYNVTYTETEDTARWERQPRFGPAEPIDEQDNLTPLLSMLPERFAMAATAVATGEFDASLRPTVVLTLGGQQRTLLHQVHEASDWVFTIDRNLGVEFFDHGRVDRPEYLIDHAPSSSGDAERLVITSRATEELEAMLRPVLESYNLPVAHALEILSALRVLSGRLALKLLSTANDQAEVLGLALAEMFLDYHGALRGQLIIPLDAHPEFYRSDDPLDLHLRRTDLALFELSESERTITCRLIEVKCYRDIGSLYHYQTLKSHIAEQIGHTAARLEALFVPRKLDEHPATPVLRARALQRLLTSYLERAQRYKSLQSQEAQDYRGFLSHLEAGYVLTFDALLFVKQLAVGG